MFRVVVDTNIFVDFMYHRYPYYELSEKIIGLCEEHKVKGYVTTSTLMDLHYIFQKLSHSCATAGMAIEEILKVFDVIDVTKKDILASACKRKGDFEDIVIEECSINNKIDSIITRNVKDYESQKIKVLTPEEALLIYK